MNVADIYLVACRCFRRAKVKQVPTNPHLDYTDMHSPLKADELQVLRAQYEKEGEYVGLQTKFNYAWVRTDALYTAAYLAYRSL